MARRRLASLGASALVIAAGCAGERAARSAPPAAPHRPTATSKTPELVTKPRVFLRGSAGVSDERELPPDGRRAWIDGGMRLLERPDGTLAAADQLLPAEPGARSAPLPARLGGGFLFYSTGGGRTLMWRAESWAGALQPLANLAFDVADLVPGFDRLYLVARTSGEVLALDPRSGAPMGLGPLPPAPAYGQLAFTDGWLGAADVPLRGVLATFDAGQSWHPIGLPAATIAGASRDRITLHTSGGVLELDSSGALTRAGEKSEVDALFRGAGRARGAAPWVSVAPPSEEVPPLPPAGPLGREPLLIAVLHGVPDAPGTAVVAANGAVARVRLADAAILRVSERQLPEDASCQGIPLGRGLGFVCGEERGATTVYALDAGLALRAVMSFDEPRYVSPSGNGALVVRGGCPGRAAHDAYCIRGRDGAERELRVEGEIGVERAVALSDGRAAVLVPPRLGAAGALVLIGKDGATKTVPLRFPKLEGPTRALVEKGLWLDGFVESAAGGLSGWIAGAGPFIGVRVSLDGKVALGALQQDLARTLFSGPLALSVGTSGVAAETVDGGFHWREVDVMPDTGATTSLDASRGERGCTRVGCASARWLRVGWAGGSARDAKFELAQVPRAASFDHPRGARWTLECRPTGVVSGRPAPPETPRPGSPRSPAASGRPHGFGWSSRRSPSADTLETSRWSPFRGVAPPRLDAGMIGFGVVPDPGRGLAGYVWGERGASWDRAGRWMLRGEDPYAAEHAAWSTAVTRSPWADAVTAAQRLGAPGLGTAANFSFKLDPSGRAGLLLISGAGITELFAFEAERSITRIDEAGRWGLTQLTSAVRVGASWYLGVQQPSDRRFRVLRADGNHLSLFRDYPNRPDVTTRGLFSFELVRNTRADALGVWVNTRRLRGADTAWYVYPIALGTGSPGVPVELAPPAIARARACGVDEEGWLLDGLPAIEPYLDFSGAGSALRVERPRARMIASEQGLCIDSLAADLDGAPPTVGGARREVSSFAAGRATVPMTISARAPDGRRWAYRCAR